MHVALLDQRHQVGYKVAAVYVIWRFITLSRVNAIIYFASSREGTRGLFIFDFPRIILQRI
jgi:hypothetical protein